MTTSNEHNNAPAVPDAIKFVSSAQALLDLDADGALVPHGIGGHARKLLTHAIALLTATPSPAPAQEVATLSLSAEDVHAAFAKNFPKSRISQAWINFAADIAQAIAARAAKPAQEVGLTGCNCRWDGSEQVQWCELHLAHKDAIHEWAERAKTAEAKLDRLSSNQEVGLTDDQADAVSMSLRRAWPLGQTYWQQADSDYISQHKKSEETQRKFEKLCDDTIAALRAKGGK